MNEENLPSMKELCARFKILEQKVLTLQSTKDFLEAEVLALGNLLLKRGIITVDELDVYTKVIIKQKMSDLEASKNAPIAALREEFLEEVQKRIEQ